MVHPVLPAPADRVVLLRATGVYGASAAGVTAALAVTVWVSQHIEPDPLLHECALFTHLVSLIAGMGAVLTLDWFGTRWLLGHHERIDVMRLAGGSHALIWTGLIGLTLSGMFLQPDLDSAWTPVKLAAVLAVALNGVHAHALQRQLEVAPVIGRRLILRAGAVAVISQAGWWTAVVVGYCNAR